MASKLTNLENAVLAIDAKMGKLSHRRAQLEAQISSLKLASQRNATSAGYGSGVVAPTTVTAKPVTEVTNHFSSRTPEPSVVRNSVSDTDATVALCNLIMYWETDDNNVCMALQTLSDYGMQPDNIGKWTEFLCGHSAEITNLANEYGLNTRWLVGLL